MNRALQANRKGFHTIQDQEEVYYCPCGWVCQTEEASICPICGKSKCPGCTKEDDSHDPYMCFDPEQLHTTRPEVQDVGGGYGETRNSRLIRLNEQGRPW